MATIAKEDVLAVLQQLSHDIRGARSGSRSKPPGAGRLLPPAATPPPAAVQLRPAVPTPPCTSAAKLCMQTWMLGRLWTVTRSCRSHSSCVTMWQPTSRSC